MRAVKALLFCILLFPGAARASSAPCTVEQATNEIQVAGIERQGRSAQLKISILNELQSINAKATDAHKPLGAQLKPRDAARFAELGERLRSLQLAGYVESAHSRDAKIAWEMFRAARKFYVDPNYSPPASDHAANIVFLMRFLLSKGSQWSLPSREVCSVSLAIAREQAATFKRIEGMMPMFSKNEPIIANLRARYRVGSGEKLDPARMTPDDARTLESMQVELQPAFREQSLSTDLQNIRAWWHVADFVYRSRKEDVTTYGSFDHLGDTLQLQQRELSQDQRVLIGLWGKLDELIPSDARREMEQAAALSGSGKEK